MVQVSGNVTGVNLDEVITPNQADRARFRTGTTVLGDDGNRYQYALASAAITASTTVVNITESSGVYSAAATGGSSTSPSSAVANGDYAWFALT